MQRIALVTDSAADLPPALAAALEVTVVPLLVYFGDEEIRASDLPPEAFWERMAAPGTPLPRTSACSPADFLAAFQACFDGGAEAIICVTVGGKLSATLKSAQIAAQQLAPREIHVIDSECASMGEGLLLQVAAALREAGEPAAAIAERTVARVADLGFYVVLETLDYLRRGRAHQRRPGGHRFGACGQADHHHQGRGGGGARPRAYPEQGQAAGAGADHRPAARPGGHPARPTADIEAFRDEVMARTGLAPDRVSTAVIGASIGPHVGPGAYGAVCLYRTS